MRGPLPVYLIHYRAPDWIVTAVATALRSEIPVRVCIVDNGGLPEDAQQPHVRVIAPGTNTGFAGAANLALEDFLSSSASDYCLIGSHDLDLDADSLSRLVAAAEAHPEFGLVGPELTNNFLARVEGSRGALDERRLVSGGCMLLRRECVIETGGFDAAFDSYGEDEDLSLRARQLGWRVGTVRGLVVRTQGTHDVSSRRRLAAAALVSLGHKQRGVPGALRGAAGGLRRALRLAVAGRRAEALQVGQGVALGLRRVQKQRRSGHGLHGR